MAITITRTAWTDDDGSGTTGTVINNAVKTGLYNQIDTALALLLPLAGGTVTGATTFSGAVTFSNNFTGTATGSYGLVSSFSGENYLYVENTSGNAAATASLKVNNDGGNAGYLRTYGSGAATSGIAAPNALSLAAILGELHIASSTLIRFYVGATNNYMNLGTSGGLTLNSPTGGDKGAGTINIAGDLYKNNTAYANPDYVFERWATGRIRRFAKNEGAASYQGLQPLSKVEAFARAQFVLPRIADWRRGKTGSTGLFGGGDAVLASIEEAYLYLFQLNHRLSKLEAA